MKVVKYVIGSVLLFLALIYVGILVALVMERENQTDAYQDPYLEVHYLGCERLGTTLENPKGEILEAYEDYTFYRLLFEVANQSNERFWSDPADVIFVDGDDYDDVWEVYDYQVDFSDCLFYSAAEKVAPGKTSVMAELYVTVRDGVEEILASYHTDWGNWDESEEELRISLAQEIL